MTHKSWLFQRRCIAIGHGQRFRGSGPVDGVGDDALHLWMMIGGKRFVAGAEIENLALPTRITAAAAEDLAAAEPADQDQAFRLVNIEVLAVHLFVLQLKVFSNACDNRVTRLYHPQALMIIALAPSQIARGAQQTPE